MKKIVKIIAQIKHVAKEIIFAFFVKAPIKIKTNNKNALDAVNINIK